MKININRELITARMNALALHERTIVQRTQIPQYQFRQARQSGQWDGHTTLSQVQRLATELGVGLGELLDPPATASVHAGNTVTPDSGTETLIPILISATNMVSLAHAARVLGWTRDYLDSVLGAIPATLEGTGLRLHHVKGRAKIMPTDSPGRAVARTIGRLQTMTAGLNLTQARTLHQITNGEAVFHRNIGKEEKLTLGALSNMGCIELDEKAGYRPTDDLRLVLPDLK